MKRSLASWTGVEDQIDQLATRKPESVTARLGQSEWWRTRDGRWLRIAEMELRHRRNAAAMLLRNAAAYEFTVSMSLAADMSEHVEEAFMEAAARRMENPHRWMRGTRLYRALIAGLPDEVGLA